MENAEDFPSIGHALIAGDDENNEPLPSLKELLRHTGEAQESALGVSRFDLGNGRADAAVEYPTPNDCDNAPAPGAERGGNTRGETNGRSGGQRRGDDSTSVERGAQQGSPNTPTTCVPGPEARRCALHDNIQSPTSDTSPPAHPPSPSPGTVSSSMSNTQLELSDGAHKDIGAGHSDEEKEKTDAGDGHNGDGDQREGAQRDGDRTATRATGAKGIRDSSKRSANNAGLNEGGDGVARSEKVRRTDPIGETGDAGEGMSDLEFARLRSLPKPVFRHPPSWRDFQQREKANSSRSSGAGDSQDNPLVLEDDGKPGEAGVFIKATSVEPETETTPLHSSHPREDSKTLDDLDAPVIPESPTEPLDRLTTPDVALIQHSHREPVHKDNYGAAAVASTPTAISPPFPQQPQGQDNSASDEEGNDEWEIARIVGRRRTRKGTEYELDWRKTWKPESELGNAQRLIQEFEVRRRARGGGKVWRRAQTGQK